MGERYELFVTVPKLVQLELHLPYPYGQAGRPLEDRAALARALLAKEMFDMSTMRELIVRLDVDRRLCSLCG